MTNYLCLGLLNVFSINERKQTKCFSKSSISPQISFIPIVAMNEWKYFEWEWRKKNEKWNFVLESKCAFPNRVEPWSELDNAAC